MTRGGYRKGAGRPTINRKDAVIYVKVTADEKAAFTDRAAIAGMTLSEWVRARCKGERT